MIRVKLNGFSFLGTLSAVGERKGRKPVDLGDQVCLQ